MLKFNRVKQQNFYVAKVGNHTILKSYNTIVGIVLNNESVAQVKYSRTTSKQVSQYTKGIEINHIIKDVDDLQDIIYHATGLLLDTRYNCA